VSEVGVALKVFACRLADWKVRPWKRLWKLTPMLS